MDIATIHIKGLFMVLPFIGFGVSVFTTATLTEEFEMLLANHKTFVPADFFEQRMNFRRGDNAHAAAFGTKHVQRIFILSRNEGVERDHPFDSVAILQTVEASINLHGQEWVACKSGRLDHFICRNRPS